MSSSDARIMWSFRRDASVLQQKVTPGTVRRIAAQAAPYRLQLCLFLLITGADAVITVANPLLLRTVIDNGILAHKTSVVVTLAVAVAGLAVIDAGLGMASEWYSARIGESLIYDLRNQVYDRIQHQSIAFFMRTQTGALISRLNSDVVGAQQAITGTLSTVVANVISLLLVLATMFYLSWFVTAVALVLVPLFIVPAKLVARRMQQVTRAEMQLNAEMGAVTSERFNVAGAMLAKLYGRPREDREVFASRARRVRDVGVVLAMYGRSLFVSLTLAASLATATLYGLGGSLVIRGVFHLGTLVALTALLTRLYAPITALSNVQVDVMTALVSFDRVFEVLDLEPMVADAPHAVPLPRRRAGQAGPNGLARAGTGPAGRPQPPGVTAPEVQFDHVSFRYPAASEVSLASLELIADLDAERSLAGQEALRDISFRVAPGTLTALVGPSGAGKTTITHLVSRLYDVTGGAILIDGHDIRDLTLESLREAVGVVTQDAHLFHDTIRANLTYARPGATDAELAEACRAAQIWDLIASLPGQLGTVVGDRGYRLSGGERQRIAIARLLLKAPDIVILDEATAHLDSESEAAVKRALNIALADRTSIVIAHRLSTVNEADQILVIDGGRVREQGQHADLIAAGGLYAELYRTQFAHQIAPTDGAAPSPV
ncbi:MAG TPA: ABC transporter ATP-binding protein [Streptosporangiaceae bacterium]|nr:ABC transporter ATP-binding protein [Streptosporangiaceae bacterium]